LGRLFAGEGHQGADGVVDLVGDPHACARQAR
jgi:hypothetical protein